MLALYKQTHAAREDEKNQLFKYFLSMFVGILPYNRPVTPIIRVKKIAAVLLLMAF